MPSFIRLGATAALVISLAPLSAALADTPTPPPRIALHPSEIVDGTEEDATRIHTLLLQELGRRGATTVPPADIAAALGDGSCSALDDRERHTCLGALAKKVGADRAVLVSVAPWAGEKIILTAQSVSASGQLLQQVPPFARTRAGAADVQKAIDDAVRAFVPQISLDPVPRTNAPDPLTELVEPLTPDVPDQPVTGSGGGGFRKTAGYVLAGAGVVLLGGGGYGFFDAHQKAARWNELRSAGFRPEHDTELAQLRRGVQTGQTLGVAGSILGAAAIAGGLYLAFTAPDAAAPSTPPRAGDLQFNLSPHHAAVTVVLP